MKLNVRLARLFGIGMFLTILSFVMLQAQPGIDWRVMGPWGGNITKIKVKYINDSMRNDGTHRDSVVATAYGAGVFIADVEDAANGNPTWIPRNNGLPSLKVTALAIRNIGQGDSMYVGLDGYGIYKTVNGGLTWERAFGLSDYSIASAVINDIVIKQHESWEAYAATNNGLYRTTSFGVKWELVQGIPAGKYSNVKMNEHTTMKIYATTADGRLIRSNDGVNWSVPWYVNGTPTVQVTAMALAFSSKDSLWIGCSDGTVREVTFPSDQFDPFFVPSNTPNIVNRSSGLISGNAVTDMAIISKYATVGGTFTATSYPDSIITNDTIYMTTKKGVFKSGSKGATWAQVNVGLSSINSSAIAAYTIHNGSYPIVGQPWTWQAIYHDVFVGTTFAGIYAGNTTQNTGAAVAWTRIDEGIPVAGLRAVSVTPTYSEVVYTAGGYMTSSGMATGMIYKTENASNPSPEWRIVYPSDTVTSGLYVMDIANDWHDKGYVLVADSIYGLIRSTDAGVTWSIVPGTTNATAVYINRMNPEMQFVARRTNGNGASQLLRSTDGGVNFNPTQPILSVNYPITSIVMDSVVTDSTGGPQTLYVGTFGAGVYKSTNADAAAPIFRQVNRGTTSLLVYSISVGGDVVVIGTDFGNYRSSDKGENWVDDNLMWTGYNNGAATPPTYPYSWENVPGVYTIRGDSTWSVLLNGTPQTNINEGVFFRSATGWRSGSVVDTLPPYGTPFSPFITLGAYLEVGGAPLLMRDLSMMWKWDQGGQGTSIAGYAVSETRAVFARNNTGFPGTAFTIDEIVNSVGGGESTDTVFVWIPDTLSALRATVAGDHFDIPVFVRNIDKVNAFKVAVNIPDDYFRAANGGVYSYAGFTPNGTNSPILTSGTVTEGLVVRTTAVGFNGTEDVFDNNIEFGDTTVFYCVNPNGKFRGDREILFKIRVGLKDDGSYTLNDSIPRGHPTEFPADQNTDLFLMNGTGEAGQGSTLNKGTMFFTTRTVPGGTSIASLIRDTTINTLAYYSKSKFAVPGQPGIDSVAVFWLRREPGGVNSEFSDLPGGLAIGADLAGAMPDRGGAGNTYDGTALANHVNDNIWNPIKNTGRNMAIGITGTDLTYPYLTYNNFPEKAFRTGDAIGAFYYRNDSLVCGGWGVWMPSSPGAPGGAAITIWGDDPNTALKDGFLENEKIYFKVYDSRYKKVWDVDDVVFANGADGRYHTGGIAEVSSLKAKDFKTFGIPLFTGWNLISTNINPRWTEMETIFKPLVATNMFTLAKDKDGFLYWPQIDLDQLEYWKIDEAYWVYMYNTDTPNDRVSMQGVAIDINKDTINLRADWNLLPYWGNRPAPISNALARLATDPNLLVKGRSGTSTGVLGLNTSELWWPAVGHNGINYMVPGQGYEVYLSNATTFIYPSLVMANIGMMNEGIPGISLPKKAVVSIYNPTVTPISQTIGLKFNGYKLREGDELGIFTRDGICVGAAKFEANKNNVIAVSVFGNVAMFEDAQKVGAIEGDELVVKLYVDGQEYTPIISNFNWVVGDGSGLTFKAGTILSATATINDIAVNEELPTTYAISQNYPNPFNPTTNIKYQLPVDGFVKIKIFDMLGREIKSLVNQEQKAGYYTIEWDATNNNGRKAATGVYFYQIEASNFKKTMKMMLMK